MSAPTVLAAITAEPSNDRPRLSLLSEGFVLALLTASCYALAFKYERGVAAGFGYSESLISLSLETLVSTVPSLIAGLAVATLFVLFIPPVWHVILMQVGVVA